MYSFPYTRPVDASNMNYISAVYGVILVIIFTDWFIRGRRHYRGQEMRKAEAAGIARNSLSAAAGYGAAGFASAGREDTAESSSEEEKEKIIR